MLKKHVTPKIHIVGVIANQGKAPVTIVPDGALRVKGANNFQLGIPLNVVPDKSNGASASSAYVTVAPGGLSNVNWVGSFPFLPQQWQQLREAFNSGALTCRLAVETSTGLRAISPHDAKFGQDNPSDPEAVKVRVDGAARLLEVAEGRK